LEISRSGTWIAAVCVASIAAGIAPLGAAADAWPSKSIRIVVPFGPGGSTDQVGRLIAEKLPAQIGQQVIIDNRAGANGAVGAAVAAKSNPDGYNYLVVFDSHAVNPSLQKNLPFDTLKDFAPIMLLASTPMALVVNTQSPYRTLNDLIAAAKAKPGELTLGSGGIGSRGHLAVALLGARAGFTVTQISYRSAGLATNDVLAKQITMQMGTVFFVTPFVKSQRVRALGITSTTRSTQLPDVPTITEQGYPGYEVISWWGIVAPAGTPKPVLTRMHVELEKMMTTPDMQERLAQLGMTVRATSAAEFERFIRSEMQTWGKVVRDANITGTPD
jgi:tripartite-type tricarboxylate transporter receptor subunit TctC